MTENCNECSIAWIRGGEYAEVSAHNGSKMKGRVLKLAEQHSVSVVYMWKGNKKNER